MPVARHKKKLCTVAIGKPECIAIAELRMDFVYQHVHRF